MKKLVLLVLVLIMVFLMWGCEMFFPDSDTGTLALYLADMPVNEVTEVNVTLDRVEVKKEEEKWQTVRDFGEEGKKFDLLTLRFVEALLGQKSLEPGNYTELRLIVVADPAGKPGNGDYQSYIVKNGEKRPIFIPSGAQTGLKIHHEFAITPDVITTLIIDVDVREMLIAAGASGKIILSPTVIDIIDTADKGEIIGRVLEANGEEGKVIDDVEVLIEAFAENENEPVATAVASTEEVNGIPGGSFKLRGLEEGNYKLKIKAEGYKTLTKEEIEVEPGESTDIGTVKLEIN